MMPRCGVVCIRSLLHPFVRPSIHSFVWFAAPCSLLSAIRYLLAAICSLLSQESEVTSQTLLDLKPGGADIPVTNENVEVERRGVSEPIYIREIVMHVAPRHSSLPHWRAFLRFAL
jgi:hypothetical protein